MTPTTAAEAPAIDLRKRDSFDLFTEERLRIADLDMNGHVNNVTFIQLLENARNRFIDLRTPLKRGSKLTFMLVHFEIDFIGQLHHPGAPEAACRLLEVRRSAITLGQAVFDGERVAAVARAVIVNVDRLLNRSAPFTDDAKLALEALCPQIEAGDQGASP